MIVELFGELSADNFEIETKEVYFIGIMSSQNELYNLQCIDKL